MAKEYARQNNLFAEDSTDVVLMVDAYGQGESYEWDSSRIRDALIVEAGLSPTVAEAISIEVEEELLAHARQRVTTALIRELVNVKLFERGLDAKLTDHRRIGLPIHDLEQMLFHKNRENSVSGHNPESINHAVAETVIKEYALSKVFTAEVGEAHLKGDLHLHDLGMANRPYATFQSAALVARNGLSMPGLSSRAKPAKHASVLLSHLVKMTMFLQNNFAGAIAWDGVNVVFAPYIEEMQDTEVVQLAQTMLFEFDRLASGRGAAVFTSLDLYYEVPKHLKDFPAVGKGGKFTGKNYSEYAKDSQRFLRAIVEIYRQGCDGRPFMFPKPLLHVSAESFKEEGFEEFLTEACDVSADKGNIQFVFDRQGITAGECYKIAEDTVPYKQRCFCLQNVTLNLPRAAYRAHGNADVLPEILAAELELAARAHIQKRDFLKKQLSLGAQGPLNALLFSSEGTQFFTTENAVCLIGVLGLNELVATMTGQELHETPQARQFGLEIMRTVSKQCEELSRKYNMKFVLEQSPAESTPLRFAKLDLKQFEEKSRNVVHGDIASGAVYYTNSTHFNVSADIPVFDKIKGEGSFHPYFAGAVVNVYIGGARPSAAEMMELVNKSFYETEVSQLMFTPAFTVCNECGYVTRGFTDYCLTCESEDVDGLTRIAGSYSYTSSWNKGKLAELKDRKVYKI